MNIRPELHNLPDARKFFITWEPTLGKRFRKDVVVMPNSPEEYITAVSKAFEEIRRKYLSSIGKDWH